MNALRIARITNKLIIESCRKYANIVKSFKMTEREWEKYSELHPNAKKENHQIIPSFNRNNSSQFCCPYNNYLDDFLKDIQKLSIDEAIKKICDSEVGGIVLDKSNFAGIQMAHDICNNLEKEIENFNFDSGDPNELVALLDEEEAMRYYINQYKEAIENFFMDAFAIRDSMRGDDIELTQYAPFPSTGSPNDKEIAKAVEPIIKITYKRFCKMLCSKYKSSQYGIIRVYATDSEDRAESNDITITVPCRKEAECFCNDDTSQCGWRLDIDSLIHEFAHMVEVANPHIQDSCQKFLNKRTQNELPMSLNELWLNAPETTHELKKQFPLGPYNDNEMAKPDNFFNPYCGKFYPNGETEIFSMGVVKLVQDPINFKKEDPEYFSFIVKLMRGDI